MRRIAAGFVALAFVSTILAGSTWGAVADIDHVSGSALADASDRIVLVGYAPGEKDAAHLAIQAAGGSVRRSSPELGFAVVEVDDRARFERLAALAPVIHYVETDDTTRLTASQWNAAQWNGAQWNAAQWNGAQWNGAQWNAAQWNAAQWNAAQWNGAQGDGPQWNAARATMHHFRGTGGASWQSSLVSGDPGLVWQWGQWAIGAPGAWQVVGRGAGGADVCVLDSGVAWDHPDLAPNMWTSSTGEHGWNAIQPGASAYDDAGHGTHIAGIASGAVGNAHGVAGVGNTRIMSVKVLASDGTGHESDLAFGVVWCALNGADVGVMALSVTERGPTLERAFAYAAERDVLMLASAGNDGPCDACVAYPASDPHVVAVGAVATRLESPAFANWGPELDLVAPGVDVLGPFLDGAFAFGSGTSQAVAFAAGAAALVRDADPTLSAAATRDILVGTARDLGPTGHDAAFGHGLLDAAAAAAAAASSNQA